MISPEILRKYPHFTGANEKLLGKVAMISNISSYNAGEEILQEGKAAKFFYFITSGEVNVVYRLGDNRVVVTDNLIAGDAFGWSSMLEPHRFTATCISEIDCECIEVSAADLNKLFDEDTAFGYRFMKEVARMMRDRINGLRVQIAASL